MAQEEISYIKCKHYKCQSGVGCTCGDVSIKRK